MAKSVLYARVSTEDQAESGLGLEAQVEAATMAAGRLGLDVAGVFEDAGVSGVSGLDRRPGLMEAISKLDAGDVLIVAKRDRLGRDPIVVAMIEASVQRAEARIVSAAGEGTDGDGPTDVLMRRIIDAFAEYERLIIGARTKAALAAKKARGEKVGRPSYGWDCLEGHLVPNEREQRWLEWIHRQYGEGVGIKAIADRLTALGVAKKSSGKLVRGREVGTTWTDSDVRRIVNREAKACV